VAKYEFTREAQDKFAIASTERAGKANEDGSFAWEMAPVTLPARPATPSTRTSSPSRPSSTRSPA
jgi:acetyl-CoA C-acetyltransferase